MAPNSLYLISQSIWGSLFVILLLLNWKNKNLILLAGIGCMPLALLSLWIFKEVWIPPRLWGPKIGFEDFIFCLFTGGFSMGLILSWLPGKWVLVSYSIQWKKIGLLSGFALSITLGLEIVGVIGYWNAYIGMIILSIIMLSRRKDLINPFLYGSILTCLLYSAGVITGFKIWPDLIVLWNQEALMGIFIANVPIEESIWAFLFGGFWPIGVFYVLDLRPRENRFKAVN